MARYEAVFTGFTATAAHIHTGDVGANGPVRLPLTLAAPGAKGVLTLEQADIDVLDLGGLYVNAHSATNPGGELRGQLQQQ